MTATNASFSPNARSPAPRPGRDRPAGRSPLDSRWQITLGKPFGITTVLHWSLLAAAVMVALAVTFGPFTAARASWSTEAAVAVAVLAAVGLFVSVYLHELGHSLVAHRYGLRVERITLFMLGGMAQMADEPRDWRAELYIAIAGPIVSIVLAVLGLGVGIALLDTGATTAGIEAFFAGLSPAAALMLWLGNVNLMLAVFNMLPAFPLDGGRVLRAVLWAFNGSQTTATRWAAVPGQIFGWFFVTIGFAMVIGIPVPLLGTGIGGLWLLLIGWFVANGARAGAEQASLEARLKFVPVTRVMRSVFATVMRDESVSTALERALAHGQTDLPVVDAAGLYTGMVTLDDLRQVATANRDAVRIALVQQDTEDTGWIGAADSACEALKAFARAGRPQPVLDNDGQCVGLFHQEAVQRWLQLTEEKT